MRKRSRGVVGIVMVVGMVVVWKRSSNGNGSMEEER